MTTEILTAFLNKGVKSGNKLTVTCACIRTAIWFLAHSEMRGWMLAGWGGICPSIFIIVVQCVSTCQVCHKIACLGIQIVVTYPYKS